MADSTRKKSVIVRVPPALKRRLAREVARGGKSMNDLAVGILGSRFGVEVEAERTPQRAAPGASGVVVLRMPDRLKDAARAPRPARSTARRTT